jgi:hypothetical protein
VTGSASVASASALLIVRDEWSVDEAMEGHAMRGEEIIRRRTAVGLSQAELGRYIGCSLYHVWRLEHERLPVTPRTGARIDAVLSGMEVGLQEVERRLAAVR